MRIENTELRIGNWVKSNHLLVDKNIKLKLQDFSLMYTDINFGTSFNGIPIAEKWLLKFGFVKNQKHGIENYITSDLTYYPDNNQVKIFDRFGGSIYVENIKYVHQLQNLYFSTTQTELELNENTTI